MEHLLKSVESSLAAENWYSALALTLTLPDIAGKIDAGASKSTGATYAKWFDKYLGDLYKKRIGYARVDYDTGIQEPGNVKTFLDGNDCYALRCAYLHEGTSNVSPHPAAQKRNVLTDFRFFVPGAATFHLNFESGVLDLMVNEFCMEVIGGVRTWLQAVSTDATKSAELDKYLKLFIIRSRR